MSAPSRFGSFQKGEILLVWLSFNIQTIFRHLWDFDPVIPDRFRIFEYQFLWFWMSFSNTEGRIKWSPNWDSASPKVRMEGTLRGFTDFSVLVDQRLPIVITLIYALLSRRNCGCLLWNSKSAPVADAYTSSYTSLILGWRKVLVLIVQNTKFGDWSVRLEYSKCEQKLYWVLSSFKYKYSKMWLLNPCARCLVSSWKHGISCYRVVWKFIQTL